MPRLADCVVRPWERRPANGVKFQPLARRRRKAPRRTAWARPTGAEARRSAGRRPAEISARPHSRPAHRPPETDRASSTATPRGSGIATRSLLPAISNVAGVTSGRGSARRHSSNCWRAVRARPPTGTSSANAPCFRHADLVRAGEPAAPRRGWARSPLRALRHLQPHEDRIILLVDVVHDARRRSAASGRDSAAVRPNSPAEACHWTSIGRPASPGLSQ